MRLSHLALVLGLAACTCEGCGERTTGSLKAEREPCTRDDECQTGLCEAPLGKPTVCRRQCSSGCRAGEICEQLTPGRFSCIADLGGLCSACASDLDCPYPGDRCLRLGSGQRFCGRDCSFDRTCPDGYRCLNGQGVSGQLETDQCMPGSGECPCRAGDTRPCAAMNALGTCEGQLGCQPDGGFGGCSAPTPASESCNGRDDDCNGSTDEGIADSTCGVGACRRTVVSCADGGAVACVPGPPVAEACNGVDDDCNGVSDDVPSRTDVTWCGFDAGAPACPTDPTAPSVVRPCVAAADFVVFTDAAAFRAALDGGWRTVTFDCIDTRDGGPRAFPADLYLRSFGLKLQSGDGGGQYADRTFDFPVDYPPASQPNVYAPGPVRPMDSGVAYEPYSEVSFAGAAGAECVAGFGAVFIDVDRTFVYPSSLTALGADGGVVKVVTPISGANAEAVFRGIVAIDALGRPVPALRAARVVAGNVWAGQECCEGAVLDDLSFGTP